MRCPPIPICPCYEQKLQHGYRYRLVQGRPVLDVARVDISSRAKESQHHIRVPVPGGYVEGCLRSISAQYVDACAGFHEDVHHLSLA